MSCFDDLQLLQAWLFLRRTYFHESHYAELCYACHCNNWAEFIPTTQDDKIVSLTEGREEEIPSYLTSPQAIGTIFENFKNRLHNEGY